MRSASPGDLILFADRTDYGVGRVEIVRDRHYTSFPWLHEHGRWDRRWSRVSRSRVLAVLPATADPASIAEKLNQFANQRAGEKAAAQSRFLRRVQGLANTLHKVREDA